MGFFKGVPAGPLKGSLGMFEKMSSESLMFL